jgi:hypothetical protein
VEVDIARVPGDGELGMELGTIGMETGAVRELTRTRCNRRSLGKLINADAGVQNPKETGGQSCAAEDCDCRVDATLITASSHVDISLSVLTCDYRYAHTPPNKSRWA